MGIVYEAHDPGIGRTVALKTIHPGLVGSPGEQRAFEERFFAEARFAGQLSHPGIVTVYDVGRDPASGTLFLALEHLRGQTLAQMTAWRQPMEWRDAFRIVARLADALQHAHDHGIVHRDLKPANVMLLDAGDPKIMDFGIAKAETARFKLTATGALVGTPLYMAPEQARGDGVDGRTDVFALGAILYLLLTGRPAFEARNIPAVVRRVLHDDPPPPSQLVPETPPDADYVVGRALAKSAQDRYPSARSLREDVEDVLARRPPRHRAGWRSPGPREAPADVDDLLPEPSAAGAFDLEAELASLVADARGTAAPPLREPARGRSPTARAAAAVAVAAVILSAGWWARRTPSGASDSASPASASSVAEALPLPGPRPTAFPPAPVADPAPADSSEAPEAPPAPAVPDPPPSSPELPPAAAGRHPARGPSRAGPPPASQPQRAELAVDLEHGLRGGRVRVWVDGALVLDDVLDAEAPRVVLAFRGPSGAVRDVLPVAPGERHVRLALEWEGGRREAESSAVFTAGGTRRLRARLGGLLRKSLSLEWR